MLLVFSLPIVFVIHIFELNPDREATRFSLQKSAVEACFASGTIYPNMRRTENILMPMGLISSPLELISVSLSIIAP